MLSLKTVPCGCFVHTTSASLFLVGSVGWCIKTKLFSFPVTEPKAKGIIKPYLYIDMDEQMISSCNRGKKPGDEDFNEEDVWAVNFMKDRESSNWKAKRALEYYSSSACRRIPAIPVLPKVIPRVNSVGHHLQQPVIITHRQSSAPLRIPDWSNVVDCTTTTTTTTGAADAWSGNNSNGYNNYTAVNEINVEDDDEDGEEMVPPHEFIARRLARSPVVSCSMCEGVGRTLKGRDLSKLRNAILTKTGFLE